MKYRRKNIKKINSSRILLIPLFLLLIVGTMASVYQSLQKQNLRSGAASSTDCTVSSEQLTMTQDEQSVFDQINQYRQQHTISPLGNSLPLKQAAAWMSNDMLGRGILSHIDSIGRDTPLRLSNCGVPFPSMVAEIIDSGSTDPSAMIATWTHSSIHTSRLLNPNFTSMGVSLASSSSGGQAYWTVTFSGPELTNTPTPTLPITPSVRPSSGVTPSVKPSPSVAPSVTPTPSVTPMPTATPTGKPVMPTPTPTTKLIPVPTKGPAPTATPTPFPTIDPKYVQNDDDTQLYVSVKIPGIGADGNRTPKHLTRRIQATLYDTKNAEVKAGNADLRFNGDVFQGNMHMGKMENGIYSIKISGIRTLKNVVEPQFQRVSNERLNVLPLAVLRPGDVSEDNAITIEDYNLALKCFQDKICKRDAQEFIDFNDSGTADVVDYNLLLQSFYRLAGD